MAAGDHSFDQTLKKSLHRGKKQNVITEKRKMTAARAQKHVTPGDISEKSKQMRKTGNFIKDERKWRHLVQKLKNKRSQRKKNRRYTNKSKSNKTRCIV